MGRIRNLVVFLGLILFTVTVFDCHVTADVIPSENECRPYIEKAIHELKNVDATGSEDDNESIEENIGEKSSIENEATPETGHDDGDHGTVEDDRNESTEAGKSDDNKSDDDTPSQENQTEENASQEDAAQDNTAEDVNDDVKSNQQDDSKEETAEGKDDNDDDDKTSGEEKADGDNDSQEQSEGEKASEENSKEEKDDDKDAANEPNDGDDNDSKENTAEDDKDSKENVDEDSANDSAQTEENQDEAPEEAESEQANDGSNEESTEKTTDDSGEQEKPENASVEDSENKTAETTEEASDEATEADDDNSKEASAENDTNEDATTDESEEEIVRAKRSLPDEANDERDDSKQDDNDSQETENEASTENDSKENETDSAAQESQENATTESGEDAQSGEDQGEDGKSEEADEDDDQKEENESMPEEDLTMEFEIPKNLRPRGHVSELLGLDEESSIKETALKRTGDVVLKDLKRVFDNAIKPLELMYKYRDLSNRHFGDPEIFSKPLVLFMGPWSGGKSTILNYLTENEYTPNSIRSGAEPSPAYFNILMHGDQPEVLDGTQLAADWTFSGLQKFGQGLMDRLRGQKLPNKLLERVNIVEIPGILEVRKQVSKYFPFNDACQWFIDRADIIFLVYDPSKLDVGPETEAILDQLKGREYQTKILLNKADQVKPEELLRVQGALIWNISPLMSSAQPPVMYTVSLWSHPFENGAPIRLLQAQERAFLSDLREAIDKRIENKIASARRFAVRIRNHAKMVDCYLTTYYNQKGLFSNKKQVADKIIEHPQNYNIYEGLSTLTNISRYDLPDPEVYMDFFRLNPLYEFKKLSETCTYFKGCPINKLDIAIAYELPELVGKYKKLLEQNLIQARKEYEDNCNQTEPEPPVKIIQSR